jgi:Holliday junction resolvasome RuvABC endonuclease subunit
MLVVGLDTASNRWHAVADDGEVGFCSELKGKDWKHEDKRVAANMRRRQLCQTFGEWLAQTVCYDRDPLDVTIYAEEPIALKNGETTRVLSLAAGALWNQAVMGIGVRWVWVDISHWKRVVVGNGNADKAKIQEWVESCPAFDHNETYLEELDLFDAFCLMQYGLQALTLGELPATLK